MSKQKTRGRPPKPAPEIDAPEVDTNGDAPETPEAPKPAAKIPPPTREVVALAHIPRKRYGVPLWLVYLAAWTGSQYGARARGRNNILGIMARGTEPKTEHGAAWFALAPFAFDRFGAICAGLKLDYSDPEACIAKLKDRCPNIDDVPYTIFKEA